MMRTAGRSSRSALGNRLPNNSVHGVPAGMRASFISAPDLGGLGRATVRAAGVATFRTPSEPTASSATPEARPALLAAPANYENIVGQGISKATGHPGKIFFQGIMAGCYIGIGCLIFLAIGGHMPGLAASNPGLFRLTYAMIFPVGLLMVVLSGADLFTGNTAVVTSALFEGKISFGDLAKSFFFSYTGNLLGSLLLVALVAASGILDGNSLPASAAVSKTSLTWTTAFFRAILANWLVCIAVFHAAASSTLPGKLLGLWIPIAAFVAVGLEHSVANMFIIPMGIALGAKVSVLDFVVKNLIPVTIGNTVAGVFCMAFAYAVCYGSLGKALFSGAVKKA